MTKLRVAVVGCQIGMRHAQAYHRLHEHFELVALCDTDLKRAATVAAGLGAPALTTDFAVLLQRGDLDLVNICTPPSLHFEQIRQTLAAGCHVACEKPLVGSLYAVDLLASEARRTGRHIIPIFQYRFGNGLRKLKRLVELCVTGRCYLTTVETAWQRGLDYYAVPWRASWQGALGGCLLSHAVHAHDMLSYIVGPVARVSAFAKTLVNPVETEDCAAAALQMADGSLATLAVTLGSVEEISRLRFCFQHLVAESNTRPYDNSSEPWSFIGKSPEVERDITEALHGFQPEQEGYDGQFLHMHRALVAGGAWPVTLADARVAIELATALYHSAATCSTVKLPVAPDHPAYRGWWRSPPG